MSILSIIIPVYNIDKYLSSCLDSIVCQMNNNIEVIIVNDGSTDSSGDIADKYSQKYDFIKVTHQSNLGVSYTRNKGLVEAKGDYVWFVDGDDLIADNVLDSLTEIIDHYKVDVLFFRYQNFYRFPDSRASVDKLFSNDLLTRDFEIFLPKLLESRRLSYSPCDKIIKRQILLDNNILFKTNLIAAEDYYWNYEVFKVIKTFVFIDREFYNYRKGRIGSATTANNKDHLFSTLKALESSVSEIRSNTNNNDFKALLLYSSQLFFYNLPEFYRLGLIDKEIEQRFHIIYKIYQKNQVQLNNYNSGAETFDKIYNVLPWRYAICLYSRLINIRRCLQSMILKQTK
ncbi:glycosyltransferase [Psychrobacter maritimus]|uniref:glycosyltransferase n=1 Tax=Psychrobacter maritimus TaxID=256325 RepID=UPI001D0F8BAF|nr:glycosyltransferase [Psychrobacter maritimus]